ncbi:hypothetical protein H8959_014666 [Pygathrix nigripes]
MGGVGPGRASQAPSGAKLPSEAQQSRGFKKERADTDTFPRIEFSGLPETSCDSAAAEKSGSRAEALMGWAPILARTLSDCVYSVPYFLVYKMEVLIVPA